MSCVYKHTCPNGKVYIGRTNQLPEDRWRQGKGYIGQRFFFAIMEFGWDNIKHEILYDNLSEQASEELEAQEIIRYTSFLKTKGYNVVPGFTQGIYITYLDGRKRYYGLHHKRSFHNVIKPAMKKEKQLSSKQMKTLTYDKFYALMQRKKTIYADGLIIEIADKKHDIYPFAQMNQNMTEKEKIRQEKWLYENTNINTPIKIKKIKNIIKNQYRNQKKQNTKSRNKKKIKMEGFEII